MEKQNQVIALKSLSSMIISFLSVLGLIFTILIYFIVSPSISSMQQSSSQLFSSMIEVSDASSYNTNVISVVFSTQKSILENSLTALNSTRNAVRSTRESLTRVAQTTGYDYSKEIISLKESEDTISQVIVELEDSRQNVEAYNITNSNSNKDLSTRISKAANEFNVALSALNTLFIGMTVILILLFISILLLSAEGLLT